MRHWEDEMCAEGCGMVMVSTQVDESARHLCRQIGCRDIGGFVMEIPDYERPTEMMPAKRL